MSRRLDRVHIGLIALGCLIVAQTIAHFVAVFGFHTHSSAVDLDHSRSLPGLLSTAMIFVAALGAARLAHSQRRGRIESCVLAALLAVVGAADLVHTGIESLTLLGVAAALDLAVVLVIVVRIARRSARNVSLLMLGGLTCLVGAQALSFVYHRFGILPIARGSIVYETKLSLKEALQVAGWSLLALGMWTTAAQPGVVSTSTERSREVQLDPAGAHRAVPGRRASGAK